MPKAMKWGRGGVSAKPKPIDVYLDGGPRLQVSSGVLRKDAYDARRLAIKEDWSRGGVWREAVLALHAKRFTVAEWYAVRSAGVEALGSFLAAKGAEPLREAIRDYLRSVRAADKPKMRQRLDRLAGNLGKQATVADLVPAKIDRFLSELTDERTANRKVPVPAAGSTVNRYRAVISGLCTWLVNQSRLSAHPIRGKQVAKREEPPHRIPELSPAEYQGYTELYRTQRPDLLVLALLLLHTAADVGELFRLMVRDVDLEAKRVRLQRSKTRRHKTANKPRLVPLPSALVAELRGHIAEHGIAGSDLLFEMIPRRELENMHQRAVNAISRPELTLKDLRHIAAIAWVKAGIHIRTVSRYMGHGSLQMTMRYTEFEPDEGTAAEQAERAMETLNKTAGVQFITGFIPKSVHVKHEAKRATR